MADDVKVVRGTLMGATVSTTEDTAARLGSRFEAEKKPAKKSAQSDQSK